MENACSNNFHVAARFGILRQSEFWTLSRYSVIHYIPLCRHIQPRHWPKCRPLRPSLDPRWLHLKQSTKLNSTRQKQITSGTWYTKKKRNWGIDAYKHAFMTLSQIDILKNNIAHASLSLLIDTCGLQLSWWTWQPSLRSTKQQYINFSLQRNCSTTSFSCTRSNASQSVKKYTIQYN